MIKSAVAALLFLAAMAAPTIAAPAAHAEVCGDVGGRFVSVGGCAHPVDDIAVGAAVAGAAAAPADAAAQAAAGRPPCYTATGVPYYTPGDLPCY